MLPLMKPRGGQDDGSDGGGGGFAEDECGPDELILLLVYLYSLANEAQTAEREDACGKLEKLERELIGGLTLAITRETALSPLLQKLTGETAATCCLDHTG